MTDDAQTPLDRERTASALLASASVVVKTGGRERSGRVVAVGGRSVYVEIPREAGRGNYTAVVSLDDVVSVVPR